MRSLKNAWHFWRMWLKVQRVLLGMRVLLWWINTFAFRIVVAFGALLICLFLIIAVLLQHFESPKTLWLGVANLCVAILITWGDLPTLRKILRRR